MTLQKLDYGINQVGKENCKDKEQDDAPSNVEGCTHSTKE